MINQNKFVLITRFCVLLSTSDRFVVTVHTVVNHTVDSLFVWTYTEFDHECNIRASN